VQQCAHVEVGIRGLAASGLRDSSIWAMTHGVRQRFSEGDPHAAMDHAVPCAAAVPLAPSHSTVADVMTQGTGTRPGIARKPPGPV